jgi:hypothetical protein
MRVLGNAIRGMYVKVPRPYRCTINDSDPVAIPITRGRLSYSCELVEVLFLRTFAVTLNISPVERLCKISVFATPLRILHAYGVVSGTRELVNLPDNVLVTGNVYKILVRMLLASFCGVLKGLRSSLEV